ncbi:kinesin-associated protein 3 isoform X1 [Anabrus simplex]|uniref:kinesin-associated protein 3 isoform X1 n=1 Tax=Anabrus simplex TaxID=316456 RepID=UPI0034DDC760
MQSDDARYLKRKIRSRSIDVHPTEQALVVTYELEALILGDLGDPLLGNRKECQKIIRLKSLNENTNCAALAKEVVEKCSLIHPNKLEEVKHLISYLQKRKITGSAGEQGESPRPSSSCSSTDVAALNSVPAEKISINDIEQYVELLYEDIPEKINGSALILQLARVPDNLVELANNESVLSALARVLREDWKKSIDLSINIIYIFFCFSAYSQFHNIVLQYKIGSLCMEVLDYELRRYDQWKDELEARRRKCDGSCAGSSDDVKNPEGSNESRRTVSHIPVASADNRRRMIDGVHSPSEGWEVRRRHSAQEPKDETKRLSEDYDRMKMKLNSLIKKQDQLLRVIIYLLLNMAENTKVEDKMRKKNICGMLAKTLDRDNPNLLHLVVTFLRKLSLFRENVDDMADLNVVEKLPKVLMINNPDVIEVTLQLLFNLSFDTHLRERMVRVGFIPKVVSLLTDQRYETIVLKILYHLSMDDRCKSMFTYTDCIPLVMNMLLQSPEDELHLELIALCINLAINKRNAQMMVENNRLQCLMERAFRNQDSLIMKMIRNIAQHEGTKQNFVEFVGDIAQAIVQCENEDFVVECVGVLGNMTLPDLDFSQLMQRFNMIPWITNILVPGKFEDDLVLEVVVLLGTAAADEGCATLLCKADILISLIELLKAKQEDDEMVLQIIYVFYQISRHVATRDYLIKETEAPAYLIDLMHDKNTQIRKVCNACLEIIAECNKDWAERIKLEKFRWHNSQWLEMVESSTIDDTAYGAAGDMDELPSFYTDDMIQRTLLYPSNSDFELDRPEDLQPINDNKISSEPGSRPRSGHSHEMEADYGEPLFHKSGLSSSNSSEDLVRNGLNNLVLGPLLSSDSDLEKMDEPQYVMI